MYLSSFHYQLISQIVNMPLTKWKLFFAPLNSTLQYYVFAIHFVSLIDECNFGFDLHSDFQFFQYSIPID